MSGRGGGGGGGGLTVLSYNVQYVNTTATSNVQVQLTSKAISRLPFCTNATGSCVLISFEVFVTVKVGIGVGVWLGVGDVGASFSICFDGSTYFA